MIALLLAAGIVDPASAAIVRDMPPEAVAKTSAPSNAPVLPTGSPATACPAPQIQLAQAPASAPAQVQTLNKLPKANYEIAVNRMVAGCAAPVVVSYQVGK